MEIYEQLLVMHWNNSVSPKTFRLELGKFPKLNTAKLKERFPDMYMILSFELTGKIASAFANFYL